MIPYIGSGWRYRSGGPEAARRRWRLLPVLGAALLASGCALFVNRPSVTIVDVRVSSVGLTGATARVALDVENPNRYDLKAREVRYRLSFADPSGEDGWWRLAQGESEEPLVAKGRGTTRYHIAVPFRYADLGRALGSLLGEGELRYRLEGDVLFEAPVKDLRVPFDQRGSVTM